MGKFTYSLEMDENDDQTRRLKSIDKFTYFLETDDKDGMG